MERLDMIIYEIRELRKDLKGLDKRLNKTETKIYTFTIIIALVVTNFKNILGVFK